MSQPYDLPLFGDPDPPRTEREKSAKEKDDALNKVLWTRYRVAGIQCVDCVIEYPLGLRTGIGAANWMRTHGQDKRVLCWMHKAEYLARGDRPGMHNPPKGKP